jgi:hypothetical protein
VRPPTTVAAIAERIGCRSPALVAILDEEERWGRVAKDAAGGYALVPSAFDPRVVQALRELRAS